MGYKEIAFDLADLLTYFDELLPTSDEERGIYWFKATRPDGVTVVLCFSAYELTASIIVRSGSGAACAYVELSQCTSIQLLSPEKSCVEIISGASTSPGTRCLICLAAETVLHITNSEQF